MIIHFMKRNEIPHAANCRKWHFATRLELYIAWHREMLFTSHRAESGDSDRPDAKGILRDPGYTVILRIFDNVFEISCDRHTWQEEFLLIDKK